MYWMIAVMTLSLLGMIGMGIYFECKPLPKDDGTQRRMKGVVTVNILVFVVAQLGLLLLGMQEAMAQHANQGATAEISVGMGLSLIGIGIPTGLATLGAGIAVGPVAAAALAVIAEKPELFGRSLVYIGLAEGIAIYGLVVTILMMGRI